MLIHTPQASDPPAITKPTDAGRAWRTNPRPACLNDELCVAIADMFDRVPGLVEISTSIEARRYVGQTRTSNLSYTRLKWTSRPTLDEIDGFAPYHRYQRLIAVIVETIEIEDDGEGYGLSEVFYTFGRDSYEIMKAHSGDGGLQYSLSGSRTEGWTARDVLSLDHDPYDATRFDDDVEQAMLSATRSAEIEALNLDIPFVKSLPDTLIGAEIDNESWQLVFEGKLERHLL